MLLTFLLLKIVALNVLITYYEEVAELIVLRPFFNQHTETASAAPGSPASLQPEAASTPSSGQCGGCRGQASSFHAHPEQPKCWSPRLLLLLCGSRAAWNVQAEGGGIARQNDICLKPPLGGELLSDQRDTL